MQIDRTYKKLIRKHYSFFEANFPLDQKLALADYGEIRNGYFFRIGNLYNDFNGFLPMRVITSEPRELKLSLENSTTFEPYAKGIQIPGSIVTVTGAIHVKTNTANNFCIVANGVVLKQIDNLKVIGEQLLKLYQAKNWSKQYYVISKLYDCRSAVLIAGGETETSVVIEADIDVLNLDLNTPSAGLKISHKSALQSADVFERCQLAMSLSRIYDTIFNSPQIFNLKTPGEIASLLDNTRSGSEVFGEITPSFYDFDNNIA